MGLLDFTTRSRVLGLPVGPKRVDWDKVAKVGIGATAAIGATGAARKLRGRLPNVTDKARDLARSASDVVETVKEAREGASGSSTGIGSVLGAFRTVGGTQRDREKGGRDGGGNLTKQRLIIQEQIDVAVPRRTAYNQWTQLEDFPPIFRSVQRVDQEEDDVATWQAKMLFSTREWESEITEQIPDERIAWAARGDVNHRGVVTFHELDENLTRVQVEMEYLPTGLVERFGNVFLTVRHRVRKSLRLFKHFMEFRGEETGAWRGQILDEGSSDSDPERDTNEDGDEAPGRDESGRFVSPEDDEGPEEGERRERDHSRDREAG